MGLAAADGHLAVASDRAVAVYATTPELAPHYLLAPGRYDAYHTMREIYTIGPSDMHDMVFAGEAVIGTNTNFSCICSVDGSNSFTPIWHPAFITKLCLEDCCHLNGFAVEHGEILYATTCRDRVSGTGGTATPIAAAC